MKIAKCKCGGQALLTGENKNIPQCSICTRFAINVDYWNKANTDQYGQQLTEQNITWVEWDGDVEHLPEEGTTVFYMAPSEINQKPRGVIGEFVMFDCYPCISFWRCDGVTGAPKQKILIWLKKGDQFAVVNE